MRQQRDFGGCARAGRVLGMLLVMLALLGCTSGAGSNAGTAMAEPDAGHSAAAAVMVAVPAGASGTAEHSCMSDGDRCPASRTEPARHTPVPDTCRGLTLDPPPMAVSTGAVPRRGHVPAVLGDSYALCVIRT